jgi:hypothetical protein
MDKDDPLQGSVKGKDLDKSIQLLGEDRNKLFTTNTKIVGELGAVASAMGKDDPLKAMVKDKDPAQTIKLLGQDRNKARAALDTVVKAMDKDDAGTDPLKPRFKEKGLEESIKLLGDDRNKARAALDSVAANMDKEDDPLRDGLKAQDLDKGITLLGTARNQLQQGITKRFKTKNLVAKKAKVDDLLSALDRVLTKADSPVVIALAQLAETLGEAGSGMGNAVARAYDWAAWITDKELEIAYYRLREPFVRAPEGMLDNWINMLQDQDTKDAAAIAKKAIRDAKWVKDQDPKASAATKAKAAYVMGLALRNQLNYVEALPLLEQAAPGPEKPEDAAWQKHARQVREALGRLSTYADRFEEIQGQGQPAPAKLQILLNHIAAALKVAKEQGRMLALRSLVRLELAQQQTKELDADTPGIKESRADAEAAIKAGAVAEGHYALGRLDEELGNLTEAKKQYRAAIAKHTGSKDELSMYHEALSRVLGQKKEKPTGPGKKKRKDKRESAQLRRQAPRSERRIEEITKAKASVLLAALVLLSCDTAKAEEKQGDELPKEKDPELPPEKEVLEAIQEAQKARETAEEAVNEAEEAVKNKDPRGPQQLARAKVRLAKAYMRLGASRIRNVEWQDGLNDYRRGLTLLTQSNPTPQDVKEAVAGLQAILAGHPALNRPVPRSPQNPILALKYYDRGLDLYWSKKYAEAEKEFMKAYRNFGEDPRFLYYLGLAQLRQRTRDKIGEAKVNFEEAAKLEQLHQPESTEDVNFALEPIQGKVRKLLNRYRP